MGGNGDRGSLCNDENQVALRVTLPAVYPKNHPSYTSVEFRVRELDLSKPFTASGYQTESSQVRNSEVLAKDPFSWFDNQ